MATTISKLAYVLSMDTQQMIQGEKQAQAAMERLRATVFGIGAAIGAAFGGLATGGFFGWGVRLAAESETAAIALKVLTGDARFAKQMLQEMRDFAAATPFELSHIQDASRLLLAFGVANQAVMPTVRMLGDIAGGNADRLYRLSLAYGQVQAAGRLMGQDLLQLINAGFNPLQEISRQTGESLDSLRDKMKKGQITFSMVEAAFRSATSEGGRFFGLMGELSATLEGQFGRLRESVAQLARNVGESLLPAMERLVNAGLSVTTWLKNMNQTTVRNIAVLGTFAATFVAMVALGPKIVAFFMSIVKAIRAWIAAQTIALSLGGPRSWLILAGSLAVAAGAAVTVNAMFSDIDASLSSATTAAVKATVGNENLAASFDALDDAGGEVNDKLAKLKERGEELTKSLRTPFEVARDSMRELAELMRQGIISNETYSRGVAQIQEDYAKATKAAKQLKEATRFSVGAVERNTTAGFSAVQAGRAELQRLAEVAKQQLEQEKQQTKLQAEIRENTKKAGITLKQVSL